MKFIKTATFFLTGIIIYPLIFFMHKTYGDTDGNGWFQQAWASKNPIKRLVAVILSPIYFTIKVFLENAVPWWEELLKD